MEEDLLNARKSLPAQPISQDQYKEQIDNLVSVSKSIYSFCFGPEGDKTVYREQDEKKYYGIEPRVEIYHKWLNRITNIVSLPNFRFCIEVEDMAKCNAHFPIFCFNKKYSANFVLIPDFEIFDQNYYALEKYRDNFSFQEKQDKAIFVGSTTGTNLAEDRICCNTKENIDHDPSVRLSAAKYFDLDETVIFKLPSIVQYDTDETKNYLKSFSFTNYPCIDWNEQFKYKFILSVDGNGPTCTRVAATLLSNSVMVKYNSNWITYYHRALRPFHNFIPIGWHDDVHYFLGQLKENYPFYASISSRASEDFSLLLKKANVDRYFAAVMNEYRAIFIGKDDKYQQNRFKLDQVSHFDIDVHFSNIGDVWIYPSMTIEHQSGAFIEGLTITPASSLFNWYDISYQVMFEDHSIGDIVCGGQFAGSKGIGSKIIGFKMSAKSRYKFSLFYSGIFKNGTMKKVCNGEWLYCDDLLINSITFQLHNV